MGSCMRVEFHVQRQSVFYVFNLVIPVTLVSAVALVGFFKRDSKHSIAGPKFQLGSSPILGKIYCKLSLNFGNSSQNFTVS